MDERVLREVVGTLAEVRTRLFDAEARLRTVESEARRVREDVVRLQGTLKNALAAINRPLGRCWHGLEFCRLCN